MAIKFDYPGSELYKGIDKMSTKLGAAVLMYASNQAQKLEASMKKNRPWTDRTGMAKARLSASVSQPDEHTIRITLAHGVEYGIWLELAHGENFAIIKPTINQEGPKVLEGFNGLMDKLLSS